MWLVVVVIVISLGLNLVVGEFDVNIHISDSVNAFTNDSVSIRCQYNLETTSVTELSIKYTDLYLMKHRRSSTEHLYRYRCGKSETDVEEQYYVSHLSVDYSVQFTHGKNSQAVGSFNFTLHDVQLDDAGVYKCFLHVSTEDTTTSVVTLSYEHTPKITLVIYDVTASLERGSTAEIRQGEEVVISCLVIGAVNPNVIWYKDSMLLYMPQTISPTENTLLIQPADRSHSGIYQCQYDIDTSTRRSNNVIVNVMFKPQLEVSQQPANTSEWTMVVTCTVVSQPQALITWGCVGYDNHSVNLTGSIASDDHFIVESVFDEIYMVTVQSQLMIHDNEMCILSTCYASNMLGLVKMELTTQSNLLYSGNNVALPLMQDGYMLSLDILYFTGSIAAVAIVLILVAVVAVVAYHHKHIMMQLCSGSSHEIIDINPAEPGDKFDGNVSSDELDIDVLFDSGKDYVIVNSRLRHERSINMKLV